MHKRAVKLLVVVFACLYFGCAGYDPYRPPWQQNWFSPAPRTYYSSSRRHHSRWRVAHNHQQAPESGVTAARASADPATDHTAPATGAANAGSSSLSLAGDSRDRARAQRTLDTVDSKLGRVHAGSLSAPQKQTYDRASQLAKRAHRALADGDAAAASSLATKASSLSSGIGGP
jgi:hypothetical protein